MFAVSAVAPVIGFDDVAGHRRRANHGDLSDVPFDDDDVGLETQARDRAVVDRVALMVARDDDRLLRARPGGVEVHRGGSVDLGVGPDLEPVALQRLNLVGRVGNRREIP